MGAAQTRPLASAHVRARDGEEWKQLDVDLPEGSYTHECSLDYDPVHDVAVALIPEGFSRRLGTFLFRYDSKTAKVKR